MIAGHSTHVNALSHGQISTKAGSSPNEHCGPITVCVDVVEVSMIFLSYFLPSLWTNLWCTWKSEPLEKSLSYIKSTKRQTNAKDCHPKQSKALKGKLGYT